MKLLVWDFDGTLGYRDGKWSGALSELLEDKAPDLSFNRASLSAALRDGFPWHTPAAPHTHIYSADAWWAALEPVFTGAFTAVGLNGARARVLAKEVRARYCAADRWHVYPDSIAALMRLASAGWEHILLSNHVPELPQILARLDLLGRFSKVVNSADTGYEKPHPRAFGLAVEGRGKIEDLWMIGDSLHADFEGARSAGWKAILVRQEADVQPSFQTLSEAVAFLNDASHATEVSMRAQIPSVPEIRAFQF